MWERSYFQMQITLISFIKTQITMTTAEIHFQVNKKIGVD